MAPKFHEPHPKSHSLFAALAVLGLLLMSCGLPSSAATVASPLPPTLTPLAVLASPTVELPSATPEDTSTVVPPTDTVVVSTDTPTAVPASATPQLTPTIQVPVGSYALGAGTTAGVLQGTVKPGQIVTYTLGVAQGQPLILIADSANADVTLGVSEANGNVLLDPSSKRTAWQSTMPSTQLYTIKVIGGGSTEDFTVTIKVPQMIGFPSGTTSTTQNGTTTNGYLYSYAVSGSAGQALTASLSVPSSTAYLDIFGISSGTILDASVKTNTWTGVLPVTGDYVIEVVPEGGIAVNYALTVSSVTPQAGATLTSGNIAFAPGTTASVVQGSVQAGQTVTYTVQASKNQPMVLLLDAASKDVYLSVSEPDGTVLLSPSQKWSYWQWQLPRTELYNVQVVGGATTSKYTLTVKLPQLVNWPGESNSVTLHGNTYPGYVVSYAFRCSGGAKLSATVSSPSGAAYLDIFGVASGSLLSFKEGATHWEGVLPETGEYVVEVVPHGGVSTVFTLSVSLH